MQREKIIEHETFRVRMLQLESKERSAQKSATSYCLLCVLLNNTPVVLDIQYTICELTSYVDREIRSRCVILPLLYQPCICQIKLFSPPPLSPCGG